MHDLSTATAVYKAMKERLMSEFGLEEGEETLLDTLEGATDLQDLIAKAAREARHEEAMADAISSIVSEAQERKRRRQEKASRLRAAIAWAMQDAGLPKIDTPDMTISQRMGLPKVVYTNNEPQNWPDEMCVTKRELDKSKIKSALLSGESLPYAYLGNVEPVLTIRGK
jgi:hypothetical protein